MLATDERPEQTRRIIDTQARRKATPDADREVDGVVQKHVAAQRMLRRCCVVIPYAERLGALFPYDRTDARRSFGQLLSMIEAVALLHQYQRLEEPKDGATIQADRQDYEIARHLLAGPMARSQGGGVSDAARRFYERLREWAGSDEFTTVDAGKHEKIIGDMSTTTGGFRNARLGPGVRSEPHK